MVFILLRKRHLHHDSHAILSKINAALSVLIFLGNHRVLNDYYYSSERRLDVSVVMVAEGRAMYLEETAGGKSQYKLFWNRQE